MHSQQEKSFDSIPVHGSIVDTMGDTLTVLLESIGNNYSTKGSVPTESLTVEVMRKSTDLRHVRLDLVNALPSKALQIYATTAL